MPKTPRTGDLVSLIEIPSILTVDQVCDWAKTIIRSDEAEKLRDHQIDGSRLQTMTHEDLLNRDLPKSSAKALSEKIQDLSVTVDALTLSHSDGQYSSYRIQQCLGSGGFGKVWRGVDINTHQEVAIKELRRPNQKKNWFEEEVKASKTVSGRAPRVPRFIGTRVEQGAHPVFVMEFVPGCTATEFYKKHPIWT